MNQNDRYSDSSKRIKSLNQIYIPLKNKDSSQSLTNGRRRNSHNYNFSIHEPLSPLTTHSSFLVPGSSGKHAGDSTVDIKSKLSKESLTVSKDDPPRMPSPLRINTEKSYFLREDSSSSAHHHHNKRSNSLNSNSNSIKNDVSGIFSGGGGFTNVKIPVQRYSSIDSLNNILEDSNSEANTPIYPQPLRRAGERDPSLTHAYHSNPNLSNNKPQLPRNGLSSQQLQQLQQQQASIPLPVGVTTPVAFSPNHYNTTMTTTAALRQSPSQIPVQSPAPEKKSILLNNDYNNTYYDNNPTIDNPFIIQKYSPTSTHVAGWILLFITYLVFVIGMYAVVFSRFMSDTGNPVLDGIKNDKYYCYLYIIISDLFFFFFSLYFIL